MNRTEMVEMIKRLSGEVGALAEVLGSCRHTQFPCLTIKMRCPHSPTGREDCNARMTSVDCWLEWARRESAGRE